MKIYKPNFWNDKKNFLAVLLYPLSLIYLLAVKLRKKFINQKQFKIPIICVGNIYIGGTGKTPTSIYLANDFSKSGYNPVIIRKFYKNHQDEHELIKSYFKKLILTKDRSAGLEEAINSEYDLAILDDGFQDHRIKKNVNILCFNSNQLVGNGLVIPSGPLREKFSSISKTDCIIINGNKNLDFEKKIFSKIGNKKIPIFYSKYIIKNLKNFVNKEITAFAGIGNPSNFFELLKENNLNVKKTYSFPDHHEYSKEDFDIITKNKNTKIITTEKDFYRINEKQRQTFDYVEVKLKIDNIDKLKELIKLYL